MRWQWWIETYYTMQELHCLPNEGGYFDQDWLYMEILNLIRTTDIKLQKEEQRRLRHA